MKKDCRLKRFFETAVAVLLLLLTLPLMIIIVVTILSVEWKSPFFRQERVGQFDKKFTMWKFRTMKVGCRIIPEEVLLERDERVTFLGYYLRKWCLDELPQLWNVVRGDIYLIGTRSEVNQPDKINRYHPDDWQAKLEMPHGISGFWQINYKGVLPIFDRITVGRETLYYDNVEFSSDLKLIFRTPLRLVRGFKNNASTAVGEETFKERLAFDSE